MNQTDFYWGRVTDRFAKVVSFLQILAEAKEPLVGRHKNLQEHVHGFFKQDLRVSRQHGLRCLNQNKTHVRNKNLGLKQDLEKLDFTQARNPQEMSTGLMFSLTQFMLCVETPGTFDTKKSTTWIPKKSIEYQEYRRRHEINGDDTNVKYHWSASAQVWGTYNDTAFMPIETLEEEYLVKHLRGVYKKKPERN